MGGDNKWIISPSWTVVFFEYYSVIIFFCVIICNTISAFPCKSVITVIALQRCLNGFPNACSRGTQITVFLLLSPRGWRIKRNIDMKSCIGLQGCARKRDGQQVVVEKQPVANWNRAKWFTRQNGRFVFQTTVSKSTLSSFILRYTISYKNSEKSSTGTVFG